MLASHLRQPQLQPPPVFGIGLAIDQSGTHQCVNRPADCGSAALYPACNLIERSWLNGRHGRQQVSLLAHRLGRSRVSAQLLDQSSEA